MNAPRLGTPALLVAGAGALLAATAPAPAAALAALTHPDPTDPVGPLVAAISLCAEALSGWLLVLCLVTTLGRVSGRPGRLARALAVRLAPSFVRHAIEVALGLGIVLSAAPAQASSRPAPPPSGLSFDWPGAAREPLLPPAPVLAPVLAPALAPSVAPSVSTPVVVGPPAPESSRVVVVRPGDSLWRIAASRLGQEPRPAQIAAAWPAWWTANRDAIGPDPDLIHPGTRLVPPVNP